MDQFDENTFGAPKTGEEKLRDYFYGELARGSEASKPTGGVEVRRDGTPYESPDYLRNTTEAGMLTFDAGGNASVSSGYSGMMAGEDTTPSLDSVTSTPTDWTAGISRQMEAEQKMRRTVAHLRSLVLFDKDYAFQSDLEINRPDLMWLADDSVRADRAGFNLLLGGELSRAIGEGDTFGLLEQTIAAMPKEEQLAAKGRMQQCDTENKAKELLGELWSGLIVKDYEAQKAELDKRNADRKAAMDELKGVMQSDWLTAVMEGHGDIPWQLRHVANMERAGLKPETIENMRATHRRAKDAWGKLMQWMYGTSYTQAKANARAKGKELMREWDDTWHFSDRPSEADFYQQGAAELSESFDMSREQMAELLLTLTNDDGQLDEQAMALFLQALEKEAKSNQTVIYSKFWRNFGEAVADWASETGDMIARTTAEMNYFPGTAMQVVGKDQTRAALQPRMNRLNALYGDKRIEMLKGYLTRFDDMRVEPSERRLDYMTDMLTKLGTTVGDSAPMMVANMAIPGWGGAAVGGLLMYPALTNEAIARNYAMGATNPELLAGIEGGWEAASETLFSFYGGGLVSKGLIALGAGKLMGAAAIKTLGVKGIGKVVGASWGNWLARYGGGVAFESFGEIVVEETVAETGTYATVQGLRALGVDLDDREWAPFKSTLQILDDPGQTGAMIAYCAVLGLLGVPGNMRAARQFAADRRMLLQVGLTEEGIAEVQQELRKSEAQVSKVLADAQTKKRLAELRAAAEAKAVEEAEAEAGRPLAEEEVAEAKKKAGDKAVAEEAERIITEAQKPLTEKMRAVYLRDVQNHDPVALKKRMEERGKKFLEDVETQLYAESGVMQYVLRKAGIVVGEQTAEGKYKVNLPGSKEGETHEVEWTEEQMMAYVAMERNSGMVQMMRALQARVAGEALAKADMSIGGELVNLAEMPTNALARMQRNGGKVDYAVLKDLAEDARAKIVGFMAGGMSAAEARAQMSELPGVSLGSLVSVSEGFVKRVDEAIATGEAKTLGIKRPEDAQSSVFRVDKAGSAGQSVLLYNRGIMNEREFVEDHIERDVVAAVEGENATTSWEALEAMLKRVEREMVKAGGGRIFKKGSKGRDSVIEAFSSLAQSYFLLNHGQYDMSAEAHATIEYVQKRMVEAQFLMTLSHAWDAFAKSKEGKEYLKKEGASLEKLLSDAGASVAGKYAAAKFDADAFNAVREAYEGSSMPSPEAAKPVLEQYESEMEELDHPEAEGEPVVVEAQESITGEQLVLEPEAAVDEATGEFEAPPGAEVQQDADMKGRGLVDGKYVLMEGGSVYGVAEVDSIELSEDVPQFKKKDSAAGRVEADADGTTHELAGGWNANSAPIHVWRRMDGRLEVISGRHRLAHAKKNGVKHIAVRVYDEAEGLDAAWAKLHDVEQNILDNTCNAIDVAYYFRHNPMTLGEAEARGLMPKTKQGEQTAASRIGLYVAANASEDTFAMMVNGRCTAEDAYMACIVASSAEGQQLALETRAGTKGKKNSWEYVTALVRGAEQMQPADAGMLDLFGNDTAFREQSEKIARYVAAVRAGLKSQLNVLQSAGRLNKKGAVSKSLGVSVKTPKDMSRLIERLALLDAAYERLDYELGIPAKVDAWDGKSAVPTKLDELDPGKIYVAKDVASDSATYSIIGPSALTWDKHADRAFRGRDDGKLKAEIDASQAKVKAEALRGHGSEALKKAVANVDAETRAMAQRWRELDREVQESEDEAVHLAYFEADDALNANMHETLAQSGADVSMLRKYDVRSALTIKAMYAESVAEGVVSEELAEVVDSLSVKNSVFTLDEVLDYKELYEAYPWLAKVQLHIMDVGTEVGGYTDGQSIVLAPYWVYNTEKLRSALLHELQHMVQFAEGFTTGDMPAVMVARLQEELEYYEMELADLSKAEAKTPSEAKALAEAIEVTRTRRDTMARMLEEHRANPHELYMRLAGEIEARNVQARMNMTAEERLAKPFNETLEYRGEAITPITFSLNGKEYFSDKNGNPVSFEELIERSRQGHEELFAELMKAATPEMREAVAKIEAVLSGKLDKSFRYRDLTAEEVDFFESRTGVDFSDYEWRIVPRALLHENKRADNKRGWPLTETELKLLPYFIDSMMQNKETLAVSLGNVNAKGVRSLMVELENPITNTKLVFEASSKKHSTFSETNKKAPRLSLSSAKMLLLQRAGLAPASTHKSVPSGDFNVAENAGEVKQNLLKQEFSSKDTSINSTKAPAVFGAVEDKLGGWQKGTVNVDIGGGKFDTLTQKLAEKGVTNYIYEPFGRSINANAYILAQLQARKNLGDTATCSNVLNVIKEAEIRANVVHQVAKAIKPDGVAYFTIYEGDKTGRGKKTKDDCWQNNRKTVTYVEEVKQFFGDVELKGGVIVARAPLYVNEPAVWKLGSESEKDFVTFSLGMTAEMADIKAAAEAAGTFMKAPNGKPSKLNAVQWMQVRTKVFKRWFGDWENDPANASRVVDENGEPLVVYHGSPHYGFTVFDKSRRGERDKGDFGRGFYFTPNRGYAATYGKEGYWNAEGDDSKVYACFLNIREPIQVQARQAANMERWRFEDEEGVMVYTDKFYDLAWNDVSNLSEIVVHDSTQIKSATDNRGTFDGENADITYSIIGPKALTWDEYADRAFVGRDDGKLKAEIDASQAKVKAEALKGHGSEALKKAVANVDAETRAMAQRWRELDREVQESEDEAVHLAYFEADDALNANMHEILAQSGADVSLLRKYDGRSALTIKAMYAESVAEGVVSEELAEVVDSLSVKNSVFTLEEVLDYKELYEAYPWLAKVQLHIMDVGTEVGGYTDGQSIVLAPYWVYNTEKLRSALLHELQHMVQFAEGFTTGDMPAVMVARLQEELEYYEMELADLSKAEAKTPSEAKALAEAIEVTRTRRDTMARMLEEHRANPHELYMRLAGEIEARNVQARMNMTAEERLARPFNETLEYRGEAITPITFSIASQREIIDRLKGDKELGGFMRAVDKVEGMKERKFSQTEIAFGVLSDESLNRLLEQKPGWPDGYNLSKAKIVINETDIWHIYRGHCLDYYLKADGLNLTYDDIRMIPDILQNYDTITPDFKDGKWGIVFTKQYGDVEYRYSTHIGRPSKRTKRAQEVQLASGWLIKKAVAGDGLTPQQPQATSASRFHRTAIVTPMEEYIKQNYASEAKKIVIHAKDHKYTLHAPNGKITNLTPVQWLAVRLQSFKAWFGDWENDPANASKVVDENGEPKVVYHGTRSTFTVFDRAEGGQSNKYAQVGFWFSPIKGFGERFAWNAWWGDGEAREMAVFLNMRNPKVFEGRKGEPYGDAYEQFRTDVVALLGKDAEFANIGGLGMAWHKGYNKMGIPNYMTTAEERAVIDEYREKLTAEGYDGILIKQTEYDYSTAGSANDQYVVFESAQVKSATDNRGSFNGGNADITFSLGMTAEMADIKVAAEAAGTFMKAPNGKPSKLNAVQWMQVRTKAFKRWFGDWENDPANASRVVDENGEPKVVYHGTNRGDFKEFSTSNQWGYGAAYFASLRAVADAFASPSMGHLDSRVYEVFVNLRNPLVIEADNARYFAIPRPEIMGHGDSTVDTQQVAAFARDNGYDGVIVRDVNESEIITDDVLAFDAKQIKSATDNRGTFDGGNADITYSLSGPSILDAAPTGRMAGEEKMQRLLNYARKEAARWGRTFSKETPNARAAEAMGTVSSLLASIHKELPPMYRPKVEANMRYVEVYARLIESGKIRTYGKLSKEQRAEVEAELMEALREAQQRAEAEYEQAKAEALQAAELTGEMAAAEAAAEMEVENEVKRAEYLERLAKRVASETRKRLLAEAEAKRKQLEAEVEALKRDFGAEKLGAIAKRMLTDAADSVERYLIDTTLDIVPKLLERLAPKKLPNGKFDKGKMSADGYRKLVRYVEMLDSTAEEVAERMEALGLLIAAEEAKSDAEGNADTLEALQAELAEWSTYGNLRGKRLEAVRAGVQALVDFAAYEKNAWQSVQKLKRDRVKRQALNAAEALGGADEHKVKAVTEKEEGLLRKGMNLIQSMRSLSQMFYSLGGVPELRALADESLDALSAGHVALTMREKRAYEQLAEFMKKELGLDTENKRNDFMAALKKLHDTGIRKAGELVHHKLKLSPEEAAMWLSMTKEERDSKRAELGAEADKKGVLVENVPYEEDIPLLKAALDAYNEKPAGKKWVHTEREFRRPAPTETMKLSKDEALNILLLCEQDDYVDAAADNGYTAEVLDQLREFVGSDVLSFGYALRDVLENNGLAEVYEAREGVPFPKVANYWPGNFDQSARANEQANALDPTSGNGTRYGMLITRVKHKLRFNILGATNVFMAALAQQNNYICIGELTAKWRTLLSHSDFAMALKAHMGASQFQTLKELINLLDGAGVQESVTQQALSGMTAMFQSAHAMAVLAGSPLTLIKQVSAMFNAGAWQGISMSRVAARLILDRAGKGAIKYGEMLKKDYFQARYKDNRYFTAMLQLGRDANWSRLSKLARSAMNLIEATDVATNCFAMTALYNITYHALKHRNKDAVDPLTEEEIHAECDRVVRNTLELGAQPLRRTQKSAFAALGNRNAVVKTLCYMNSEALNKIGMALATMKREGGGLKGGLKAWKYIAAMSFAQQLVIMAIDMWRGAAPIDDDEWAEWALLNLATGASGLGILQTVPVLGEALQWGSGGYIKTGSMGEMVYDFGGMAREMKKGWDLVVFNSEDSVEIKKSRKSPYWQVTYKKQDGSRVTTSTDVPVEGGEFEGVELSKEEAEAKALEVGKRIAEEDAPGWADWGLMGSNLLRGAAAFTGAWRGINSTSKVMSELSGMLQSLNAVGNVVRPFMQAERNEEKREKEFNKKLEKGFREARKKTNERLKKQREEAKKKKKAEKKRL